MERSLDQEKEINMLKQLIHDMEANRGDFDIKFEYEENGNLIGITHE